MAGKLTQRSLADMLGVSYPTVNRALNNTGRIRPRTRERILEAARQLGYRKNIFASSLASRKTHSIGLVGVNFVSIWRDIISGIEGHARTHDYHLILCHRPSERSSSAKEIKFLLERQVGGIILSPNLPYENIEPFIAARNAGVPILVLFGYMPGLPSYYLGTDTLNGTREGCRYLLGLGHRRIAFVEGTEGAYHSDRRLDGYRTEMQNRRLKQIVIKGGGWWRQHGRFAAERILELEERPTAVFASNDLQAIGIFKRFSEAGIRIPEDVSLLGYSGMEEGELLSSPLTSIAHPLMELGRRACERIVNIIEQKGEEPKFEELPDKLLVRESCGPPAHGQ